MNILWLPFCRINKFGLNTLPSKNVVIPYTCGLSTVSVASLVFVHVNDGETFTGEDGMDIYHVRVGKRSNFKKFPTHTQDHGDA